MPLAAVAVLGLGLLNPIGAATAPRPTRWSRGGVPAVQISLSNVFRDRTVTFDSVYVGIQTGSAAALAPGSNREVTFSGQPTVTVPAGAEILSDPVDTTVPADTTIAVSVHVVGTSGALTGHNFTAQTSYASAAGDFAADESGTPFAQTVSRWYWVDAVVVEAPKQVDAVAFLGDSITDGVGSTTNTNRRYPDYVADRLATRPSVHRFGIMNEGISGNRVLVDSAGVSVQARFDRDVLSQPDVHAVIVMEGINDIGNGTATSADQLIAAYKQLIARARQGRLHHRRHHDAVRGRRVLQRGQGADPFRRQQVHPHQRRVRRHRGLRPGDP